jgi:hypothetical protein
MDALTLDARTLLFAARAVGLAVAAAGDRLNLAGPEGAVGLVQLLLERKPDILAVLEAEPVEPNRNTARLPPWSQQTVRVAGPPIPAKWHGASLDGQWRKALAWWPIEWQHKWKDRVKVHELAGQPCDVAEYWAFQETAEEINAAQSRGEVIPFVEPEAVMCDEDALAAIGTELASPARPTVASDGPRDVRKGDRWLRWHGANVRPHNGWEGRPPDGS